MIRIFIADDHNLFREGLLAVLEEENDMVVVGQAENGKELIQKYEKTKPDLIISDISMPIKSGPHAIRKIRRSDKTVKVLFLTQHSGDDYIYSAFHVGAQGLISKSNNVSNLMFAIKEVVSGRNYFMGKSETELNAIENRFAQQKKIISKEQTSVRVTKREEEIVLLISERMSTFEIANKLGISIRTVESHRLNIIKKFKLKSLIGLITFSIEYSNRIKSQERNIV